MLPPHEKGQINNLCSSKKGFNDQLPNFAQLLNSYKADQPPSYMANPTCP